ncbi:Uncharacterized protein Rs2_05283 [Raphanus sativus]|nr:Uncharacterized protein Rs2_05283 [Raphanus sativus]
MSVLCALISSHLLKIANSSFNDSNPSFIQYISTYRKWRCGCSEHGQEKLLMCKKCFSTIGRCCLPSQETKQQWRLGRKLCVLEKRYMELEGGPKIKPGANLLGIDGSDSNKTGRERFIASTLPWESDHRFTFRKHTLLTILNRK